MEELKDLHYDAFISYRHSELDSFIAENLHRKLENFKLPRSVIPKVKSGKTRIERVFRDVDELPLSEDLSDPISKALKNSDYLITICTPRYPQSRWCMKEIEVFLQTHTRDHILVVLAEDEPVNSFPEILCYDDVKMTDENGKTVTVRREVEPLAADTRGENKKEIIKAMNIAVIKICAAIFGLNYDELRQRHREQKLRRMAAVFGSIGAAVLAFAIFAAIALIKISKQNVTIKNNLAVSMANVSGQLLEDGRRLDAIYAVRSVLPEDGDYNAAALSALYQASGVYDVSKEFLPAADYEAEAWLYDFKVSYDKKYILLNDAFSFYVYDIDTAELVLTGKTGDFSEVAFCGSEGLLVSGEEGTEYYPLSGGKSIETEIPAGMYLYQSPTDFMCFAVSDSEIIGVGEEGHIVFEEDLSAFFGGDEVNSTGVIVGGQYITICFSGYEGEYILAADRSNGSVLYYFTDDEQTFPSAELSDGIVYMARSVFDSEGGLNTEVTATDLSDPRKTWTTVIEGFMIENVDMTLSDGFIYLCSVYEVAVLDRENGEVINRNSYPERVISGWTEDDGFYFIVEDGDVFYIADSYTGKVTDEFFRIAPGAPISNATYVDGDLFCSFEQADYVTRYSNEISPYSEQLDDYYEGGYHDETDAYGYLEEHFGYGTDTYLIEDAFFSDDGKYVFALLSDHTARIYDADDKDCTASFETADTMFDELVFSDVTGGYILSGEKSYIFDDRFRVICVTDRIVCEEDDGFILMNEEQEFFKVPFFDRKELLEIADRLLEGYEPPKNIREKYGI
jgi:hypothetical protein